MEIDKDKRIFWATIESDLKINIPEHIQNTFRFANLIFLSAYNCNISITCRYNYFFYLSFFFTNFSAYGLASAFAFKNIDENDIKDVEEFTRFTLLELLKQKAIAKNEILPIEEMSSIFGNYHLNPEDFEFSSEEKKQILKLVKHVNYKVDLDGVNENLAHFCMGENDLSGSANEAAIESIQSEVEITRSHTHTVLNKLLVIANRNVDRKKEGYRFDDDIKKFASYLRLLAGPYAYETLQKNLELCLPSLSSTNRYVRRMSHNIVEGVVRAADLAKYLKDRNLPPFVSLSEDATRITGIVQYDARTNQLVGFVLPVDEKTGMPIPFSFQARSADEILGHFTSKPAVGNFVNVIMAQPLGRAPPFCLLLFASDSQYTAENVADRWNFITEELKKYGINVLTISSDGDSKFHAAMKRNSGLGLASPIFDSKDFCCTQTLAAPFYMQDIVHIVTKLRNLLLRTFKQADKLPFGPNCYITIAHLQYLIENFSKDQHLLTASVINPEDHQNYSSAERICSKKVTDLLKLHVEDSIGTVTFLEMIRDINDSFLDKKLLPLERVRKIWYVVFVLRLWREYVKSENLSYEHFLTSNCYSCIELNAHSLVLVLLYLKQKNMPHLFKPELFTSQACEETFRRVRSFTTVYSTVANCSVKEIIGRLDKIQLQSDISLDTNFLFPRAKVQDIVGDPMPELPSREEIFREIEECKLAAIRFAKEIGLLSPGKSPKMPCGVNPCFRSDWYYLPDEKVDRPLPKFDSLNLRDFSSEFEGKDIPETSSYVEVSCTRKKMVVQKISLCWFLRDDVQKLSSDRLKRVKAKCNPKKKVTQKPINIKCNPKSGLSKRGLRKGPGRSKQR